MLTDLSPPFRLVRDRQLIEIFGRSYLAPVDGLAERGTARENVDRRLLRFVFVRRWSPGEFEGREFSGRLKDGDRGAIGSKSALVDDVQRCTVANLPRPFVEGGFELQRPKDDPGKSMAGERLAILFSVQIRRSDDFERNRRAAAFRKIRSFE